MLNLITLTLAVLLPSAEAEDVGAAISVRRGYSCVPYIKHPFDQTQPAYHARTAWYPDIQTLQCYYKIEEGWEYMAPEGRLIVDEDRLCEYSEEKQRLTCVGKNQ